MLRYISDPRWIRQTAIQKMRILLLTLFLTEYIILAFSFHLSGPQNLHLCNDKVMLDNVLNSFHPNLHYVITVFLKIFSLCYKSNYFQTPPYLNLLVSFVKI